MHKYLRAIGFARVKDHRQLRELISDTIEDAGKKECAPNSDTTMLASFSKEFAPGIGLTVCGEFDKTGQFTYEYNVPFFNGSSIASYEDMSVERHAEKESYSGICDEIKLGVSLVFYLQNVVEYSNLNYVGALPIKGTSLTLGALSVEGTIVLPMEKNGEDLERRKKARGRRAALVYKARKGDEEAIETLTQNDMDMYAAVSERIRFQRADILSITETCFMPYGVEYDQYSVIAEIEECHMVTNSMTGEDLWVMKLICNDVPFDLCINKEDLLGEPAPGRRFKGVIWMQGTINFPA